MKALATLFAAFLLVAQLAPGPVWAAGAQPEESTYVPPLADPVLEARAKALQKSSAAWSARVNPSMNPTPLWLPICRRLIRQQIQGGQSDNAIKDFLVARYGAFVLMKPPVREDTFFLWFGPAMLVLDRSGGDWRYRIAFAPPPRS